MDEPSKETLTAWADTRLHINHLNTLISREIAVGNLSRAVHLSERAQRRAWILLNELFAAGATKPEGYAEPAAKGN